jgi:hypothetical protein
LAELRVETTAGGAPPAFSGPTGDLVFFLSFAVAERYGATHDLSGVARILRGRAGSPDLRPLLTFAEDNPSDDDDRRDMEQIWQDAAPVASVAGWVATEIESSRVLKELTQEFPDLVPALKDLAQISRWSAERGARIRILFRL